ncbi:MAG: hypothetical protein AB7V42_07960 [Thermoleophilia bacterium]
MTPPPSIPVPPRPRSLAELAEDRRLKHNDCRTCKNFRRTEEGMNYGWCEAFDAYVKLYHPAGEFFSQCRFKSIIRPKREPGL